MTLFDVATIASLTGLATGLVAALTMLGRATTARGRRRALVAIVVIVPAAASHVVSLLGEPQAGAMIRGFATAAFLLLLTEFLRG